MQTLALLICLVPAAEVPADIKEAIDKPDSVVLYSLNPERSKEKPKEEFEGWAVLGKTKLEGSKRGAALMALKSSLEDRPRNGARCFIPRHGLEITQGKKTLRLVICFECMWVDVVAGGKKSRITIGRGPNATYNKILTDAGVPLPKPPAPK